MLMKERSLSSMQGGAIQSSDHQHDDNIASTSKANQSKHGSHFVASSKVRLPAWYNPSEQPELKQKEWDDWVAKYQFDGQTKVDDKQQYIEATSHPVSCLSEDLMVRTNDGRIISSFDFFKQEGYLASPPALSKHRRQRDAALLRHKLDKTFGNTVLDAHCQQAKALFKADFTAISLAQIDTDFVQIMGAKGAGLEGMVEVPLPRSSSLCSNAFMLGERSAIIRDRTKDWRFRKFAFGPHPDFPKQSELGFNFYVSAALMLSSPGGRGEEDIKTQVGRFCVMDIGSRDNFDEEDLSQLETISRMASDLLEREWQSRRANKLLKMQLSTTQLTSKFHQTTLATSVDSVFSDTNQTVEKDFKALLQSACEHTLEHLEAAGVMCIGYSDVDRDVEKVAPIFERQLSMQKSETASLGSDHAVSKGEGQGGEPSSSHKHTIFHKDLKKNLNLRRDLGSLNRQIGDLSSKIRILASASAEEDHRIPIKLDSTRREAVANWITRLRNQDQSAKAEPVEYKSAKLRREYAKRYPDDESSGEGEDVDPLAVLLPDNAMTYLVVPIFALDLSQSCYAMVLYWNSETLIENWDRNFLISTASIIQSACMRRNALMSEHAKLSFMRSVRHELRTPLHGIIGMSTQLQQCLTTERDDEKSKQLQKIDESKSSIDHKEALWLSRSIQYAGEDLRKLLDDILESGNEDDVMLVVSPGMEGKMMDIVRLVESSCHDELAAHVARTDHLYIPNGDATRNGMAFVSVPLILINADLEAEKAIVSASMAKVSAMLGQILSNAIRFTKSSSDIEESRPIVEVSVRLLKNEGKSQSTSSQDIAESKIEITVSDNGIGMSAEFLQRFAEPFRKANPFQQGAGVGASLACSLLDRLGGTLQVSSTETKGTSVTMTFPADAIDEEFSQKNLPDQSNLPIVQFDNFNTTQYSAIKRTLRQYVESRKMCVFQEGDEVEKSTTKLNFFFYDATSKDSTKQLESVCLKACSNIRLAIISTSLKLDLDQLLHRSDISSSPWILCCPNPLGPSAFEALDNLSHPRPEKDPLPIDTANHHRRHSSSASRSNYIELSLSPSTGQTLDTLPSISSEIGLFNSEETLPLQNLQSPPSGEELQRAKGSEIEIKSKDQSVTQNTTSPGNQTVSPIPFSVLIVEDNPINMRMLEACVKKTNCDYKKAMNGEEAVQRYKEMGPDGPTIVLLDISLPLMDGFDACKAMRAYDDSQVDEEDVSSALNKLNIDGKEAKPRIVAITALSSQQDVEKGLQCGMDEWRVKPANLPKLSKDLLNWQKQWQTSNSLILNSPDQEPRKPSSILRSPSARDAQ